MTELPLPVCPFLSMRVAEQVELCLGEQCALYVAPVKKCSFYMIGYEAVLSAQRLNPTHK